MRPKKYSPNRYSPLKLCNLQNPPLLSVSIIAPQPGDFPLLAVNNASKKDTRKLRFYARGVEKRMCSFRLSGIIHIDEHNVHDIVSDVSLPLHLLTVVSRVRQQRRDVEHDLVSFVNGVHGVFSGHVA
jgi:hypothetical protein